MDRHNPLLRPVTRGLPTGHHVQAARVGELTRTQDPVGLDDLGGKTSRIPQHPSMFKLFSDNPHSDMAPPLLTVESLCHRSGEACLLLHQAAVYSQ